MMIALEGLCFTASYLGLLSAPPCLSQLPQRSTVSQDMALSRALGPGDVHPAPMFFHLSPSKSSWVPPGPPGPIRVPPGPTRVPPGPARVHPGPIFLGPGPTPRLGSRNLIHSDVGPMHGLFDHGPVFSVVVQIIFQTGWAIACGMEVRYLLNEPETGVEKVKRKWLQRTGPQVFAKLGFEVFILCADVCLHP